MFSVYNNNPYLQTNYQQQDNPAYIHDDVAADFGLYNTGSKFGHTNEYGLAYLANNADSYANAYNQEKQWLREDMLRKEGYQREDTSYTRLFNELKSLGVNPALLLSGVSPTTGSASSFSTSAVKSSDYSSNQKTEQANSAKLVGAIIAAFALIAAHAL